MNLSRLFVFFSVINLPLIGCASRIDSKNDTQNVQAAKQSYKSIAEQRFQSGVVYHYNSSKSYVICSTKSELTRQLIFFVYDLSREKIVHEGGDRIRQVKWISNEEIEVHDIPSQIRYEDELRPKDSGKNLFGYTLNLKTGKKTRLSRKSGVK